jgi:hypothetical protein
MHRRIRLLIPVVAIASAASIAGCGTSSSGSGGTPAASTKPSTASGAPTGDRAAQLAKVSACLKAAGVALPSGGPTGLPSGAPTGIPSGAPTGGFSPPAGGGSGGGAFADPKIQAALKACGITLSGPAGAPSQ